MKALRVLKLLYVQVLIGIALGILVGVLWPKTGASLKPLADVFIALIKMIIGPVIFCTVAAGVAHMSDLKKFGRVGVKTLVYFELVSTIALLIGLGVGLVVKPGAGMNIDPAMLDTKDVANYIAEGQKVGGVGEQLLHLAVGIVPKTFISAFVDGNLLQVLLIAILTGFACGRLGSFGERCAEGIDAVSRVFFSIIHIIVRAAPIGAFGAMAYTVGKFGAQTLGNLGVLIAAFYLTAAIFIIVGLGLIARLAGFSIFRFLAYIREEIFVMLGASSSEAALPQLMEKLERLGCKKSVVGLVIPTGYSFNLDGTNIYMTLAMLFMAQACNIELSAGQIVTLLLISMVTSKGASGVTGAGFITLAATVSIVPGIPAAALALLFGIDRFMSECRGLTNLIGNGVATMAIARWEGDLDVPRMQRELMLGPSHAEHDRDLEIPPPPQGDETS